MKTIKYIVILTALIASSCGIFEPRPVEYPTKEAVQDPFNFASLLWNTPDKQFTKLAYSDLFYNPMTYIDINGNEFDISMLIDHLYEIQRRFSISSISWTPDSLQDFTIKDTFFIDRNYHVVAMDTVAIPAKEYDFSSQASFKLIFNSTKNTWNIFYWKDKYPGKSIFHPLFVPGY